MTDIDPSAFHTFEHEGWQKAAALYHDSFAAVTTQSVHPLLDAARVTKGVRVLDVACGPGYTAQAAVARGAHAVGVDFSSAMIEEARRRSPGVEFHEADAEQLPFADSSFDAVVSNFGMLHFARPENVLRQASRILRKGGRVAFTVWDAPDKAAAFGIVLGAIRRCGDMDVPIPQGPPFFRFSDPDECRSVLTAAGFSNVAVTHVHQLWSLPSADALFEVMYKGSVRTAALLRAQKADVLESIRDEIRRGVELYGNELPMPAVLASASL